MFSRLIGSVENIWREEFSNPPGSGSDEWRHAATISVWVRWFASLTSIFQLLYRPDLMYEAYLPYIMIHVPLVVLNASLHYRLRSRRPITRRWVMAPSVLDFVVITIAILVGGGFQPYFFLAYYPALALFSVIFTSFRLILAWTTVVAVVYVLGSVFLGDGLDLVAKDEKVLFARVVMMYAVVAAVNQVARFERLRRRAAVERERELLSEHLEASRTIHNTTAQVAYMIGIGIDNAIHLAGDSVPQLKASLAATARLSRSAMWGLRRPIDIGQIFEGRPLSQVLTTHTATFNSITSISAVFSQAGEEPPLSIEAKARLFSVAHNALANAFRHARANQVTVRLEFEAGRIRLAVSDDGIGLPPDYAQRGHGFGNMQADAEVLGGTLVVQSEHARGGTTVICVIPNDRNQEGT